MKDYIIILVVIVVAAVGGYFIWQNFTTGNTNTEVEDTTSMTETETEETPPLEGEERIGTSAGGNAITAHHFVSGESTNAPDTELLFVGGIHGGYSWNTALVAFELIDWLEANKTEIPDNVRVTVIPVLNPDGLQEVVGTTGRFSQTDVPASESATIPGRFNANEVDLNRNFDCDWQADAVWQSREVSGGTRAFSEPESQAIRDYINTNEPDAVVAWYSAAGGVFASNCHDGVLAETNTLVDTYADASGYRAFQEFDFYEVTGDMTNWLAKEGIPAISVLLTTHNAVEWPKNRAGIEALLEYYAN